MPDFADQHRERAIFEGMLQALALDGRVRTVEEPSTQLRAQVVEKSQLSCLILQINTGSELFFEGRLLGRGCKEIRGVR